MGTPALSTAGRSAGARAAFAHSAPLDRAPVIAQDVVLGADCTPGLAVGGRRGPTHCTGCKGVFVLILLFITRHMQPEGP